MFKRLHALRSPEGEGASGGGAAAPAAAPASPAPAPAAPAPSPAAPAAPAASPAAPSPSPAPAAPAPAAAAPAATTAPALAAGYWPENWRETVSKEDGKKLAQLQRYASPEVALQALFAAQERIRSGELKPTLDKNATPEQLAEWRAANGIPASPDKYDLGKDVVVEEGDKPVIDMLLKAAHETHQTPEQAKANVKTLMQIRDQSLRHQEAEDQRLAQETEDALRSEWGGEYRRNLNLVHSILDATGAPGFKENLLAGRLADGTPIGSSPEALRMLLGVSLIQNPTGVVVPGGDANQDKGIREELETLQKVPAERKSEKQSQRERDLYDAAIKRGLMDDSGNWKK
jgi:hypothetical protein